MNKKSTNYWYNRTRWILLIEFLLKKKYIVHGIKRKSSSYNTDRIDQIYENKKFKNKFFLHYGDLTDATSILEIIKILTQMKYII